LWSSPVPCPQSLVIPCTVSAVSGHPLYRVRSLWSSPVPCPQSLVISCTVSAVSGHPPVPCPQSLVIPCTVSAVSGHPLYRVRSLWSSPVPFRSLWSSPVPCPQSLFPVRSTGHSLYLQSALVQNFFSAVLVISC
ncbi:unnamed protein product, partial [Staurois parvus]